MSETSALKDLGVDENVTISSEELEKMRASSRLPEPRAWAEPAPFDLEDCIARYVSGLPENSSSSYYDWSHHNWMTRGEASVTVLSKEEAHFWIVAFALTDRLGESQSSHSTEEDLRKGTYDGSLERAEAIRLVNDFITAYRSRYSYGSPGEFSQLGLAFATLYGVTDAYRITLDELTLKVDRSEPLGIFNSVPTPRDEEERAELHAWAVGRVPTLDYASSRYAMEIAIRLATRAQATEVFGELLDGYKKIGGEFYYGLASGVESLIASFELEEQIARWHALRRYMRSSHGERLFARLGWDALDELVAWTISKKGADSTLDMVRKFDSPRTVKVLAQLSAKGGHRAACEDALYVSSPNLLAGLLLLLGSRGVTRAVALEMLRYHKQNGQAELIESIAEAMDEKITNAAKKHVVDWEPRTKPELPSASRPDWLVRPKGKEMAKTFDVSRMPPIFTADGEHQLTDDDRLAIIELLSHTTKDSAKAEVLELAELVDTGDLHAFSWSIYERWLTRMGKSKGSIWCVFQLAHAAGDSELIELSKELKTWPSENKWRMAQDCLEIYRVNGSDAALMTLHDIAHRVKYKSVRSRAQQIVDEIAKERGLTEEQLADRIVPDCGLDSDGRKVFNYGPRTFSLVFSEEFKPVFKDEKRNKIVKSLPKPNSKDDADLAEAAREEFKEMKKQIKQVVATQQPRLEQAMVTGRRWAPEEFTTLIAGHPLMRHFASRLLWGVFGTKGKKKHEVDFCFRVDEEGALLDTDDEPIEIPANKVVGLVHRLDVTEEVLGPWGSVFGDYEIVPPFPQLSRPTYGVEDQAADATSVSGFPEDQIAPGALRGFIDKDGWRKGPAEDAGIISTATKYFPSANITVCMSFYPGIYAGGASWDEPQKVESLTFWTGRASWGRTHLELQKVPATILSEARFSAAKLTDGA